MGMAPSTCRRAFKASGGGEYAAMPPRLGLIEFPPVEQPVVEKPVHMVVERPSGELPTGVEPARVHVRIPVGDVQVAVADYAVDQDEVIRLGAGVHHRQLK